MALRKTQRPQRVTMGDNGKFGKKHIIDVILNTRDLRIPYAGTNTQVSAAITASNTGVTTQNIPYEINPNRNITVTAGGTAASIAASPVVVTGMNREGKIMTESLTPTAGTAGTLSGSKVFASVISISIPQQTGAGATYSVGFGNNFGIGARNLSVAQVKLFKSPIAAGSTATTQTLVNPGSVNLDANVVENNWVTLDAAPTGAFRYRVYAFNYNWHLNPVNDLTKGLQSYGL